MNTMGEACHSRPQPVECHAVTHRKIWRAFSLRRHDLALASRFWERGAMQHSVIATVVSMTKTPRDRATSRCGRLFHNFGRSASFMSRKVKEMTDVRVDVIW